MSIDQPNGKAEQTRSAVFRNPPLRNIKWRDVLSMFDAFDLTYRLIDERVNVLIPGRQSKIYTLQYKPGTGCLRTSDVDDVRHLLIMSGLDPRD